MPFIFTLIACQKKESPIIPNPNSSQPPLISENFERPIEEVPTAVYDLKTLPKHQNPTGSGPSSSQSSGGFFASEKGVTWGHLNQIDVAMAPDRSVVMDAGVEVTPLPNGSMECKFAKEDPKWVTGKKWAPLPLNIVKLSDPSIAIPEFERRLEFPYKDLVKRDEFSFLVDFKAGDQVFRAIWKALVRPSNEQGKLGCRAVMQICLNPDGRKEAPECTRSWKVMNSLMAIFSLDIKDFGNLKSVLLKLHDINAMGFATGNLIEQDYKEFIRP